MLKLLCYSSLKAPQPNETWYYQLDPGRSLGKTNPLNDNDLSDFVEVQSKFEVGEKSWVVQRGDVDNSSYDLSVKNPTDA